MIMAYELTTFAHRVRKWRDLLDSLRRRTCHAPQNLEELEDVPADSFPYVPTTCTVSMPSPGHHFENVSIRGKGHLGDIYNIRKSSLLNTVYLYWINADKVYRRNRGYSISRF